METSSILSADILDILFEGRNKNYGAYELRKTYDRRIVYAMSGTFFLCLLFVVGSILANSKKKSSQLVLSPEIELSNIKQDEPKPEIPKPLPKPEPQKVEIARFTPPKIVTDDQVKPDDEIKDVQALEDTKIGTINQDGTKDDGIVAPPVETTVIGIEAPKIAKDIDDVFRTVQIEARFSTGLEGWRKYLERNLNKDLPSENGAPPADYTVTVSFIVDRSGSISDVKAENDPGYGTKAEAIRVILKSPKWSPAIQNGREVVYRQKQNITFRVSAE
jgi:protein TonB